MCYRKSRTNPRPAQVTLESGNVVVVVVGKELQLHLPAAVAECIEVHGNEINVHNLRFVIQLVNSDARSISNQS